MSTPPSYSLRLASLRLLAVVAPVLLGATSSPAEAQRRATLEAHSDSTVKARQLPRPAHDSTTRTTQTRDSATTPTPRPGLSVNRVISPIVTYSPETGFGYGAGTVISLRPEGDLIQRPTTLQFSVQLTEQQQYTVNASGDVWTDGNAWRFTTKATWAHSPKTFYGIGPTTSSKGEKWTPTYERLSVGAYHSVAPHLYLGAVVMGEHEDVFVADTVGPIGAHQVAGSTGWNILQVGGVATYDTRVGYYFPLSGVYVNTMVSHANAAWGSELTYTRANVDVRGYRSLGGGNVLAAQFLFDAVGGNAPFDRFPSLGGSVMMRGMSDGRFRDRNMMAAQTEYRTPSWHHIGAVAFAAVGAVAPSVQMFEAPLFRATGGVGLRWALTSGDRLNIRIDRGWGRASAGTYFTIGESF